MRNVLEKAMKTRDTRLMQRLDALSKTDVVTITAADINSFVWKDITEAEYNVDEPVSL